MAEDHAKHYRDALRHLKNVESVFDALLKMEELAVKVAGYEPPIDWDKVHQWRDTHRAKLGEATFNYEKARHKPVGPALTEGV